MAAWSPSPQAELFDSTDNLAASSDSTAIVQVALPLAAIAHTIRMGCSERGDWPVRAVS